MSTDHSNIHGTIFDDNTSCTELGQLPEADFGELASDRRSGFHALRLLAPFIAVTRSGFSRCRGG